MSTKENNLPQFKVLIDSQTGRVNKETGYPETVEIGAGWVTEGGAINCTTNVPITDGSFTLVPVKKQPAKQ